MQIVIPVGSLTHAKSRLSSLWSTDRRRTAVLWMFQRLVQSFAAADQDGQHTITVLTSDPDVQALGQQLGIEMARDAPGGLGHGEQIRIFCERVASHEGVLVLMSDLPLVRPEDARELLTCCAQAEVVLVPDRQKWGTNAAYFAHEQVRQPQFGHHDSWERHRRVFQDNPRLIVFENDALAMDLDFPQDVEIAQRWQRRHAPADEELAAFFCGSQA